MRFLTYNESLESAVNKEQVAQIYKYGTILANDKLVRELNYYIDNFGDLALGIINVKLRVDFDTTILQEDAVNLLKTFMNEFEDPETFIPNDDTDSREKLLIYLEKELIEEILHFGNREILMVFKNNSFIDFLNYPEDKDFYEDEEYIQTNLKKALYHTIVELYPNLEVEAVVIYMNRVLKNLSIRELAEAVGVSHNAIHLFMKGVKKPSDETKEKLAMALNIDIKEFDYKYWEL